jgi:hypothetical protein
VDDPSAALAAAVDAVLTDWVESSVERIVIAYRGDVPEGLVTAARDAATAARADIGTELRRFLAMDVDEQSTNPLTILRRAVRYPTAVLRDAGVPEVVRDEFRERAFPEDVYDLSPATWGDVDESLQEPGLVWGAWKAKTVLDRRRAEGRR